MIMELIEGIRTRRSVRKFTDEKISRDTMARIVDAARFAPTWKNSQTPRYIVVENRQVIERRYHPWRGGAGGVDLGQGNLRL